MIENKIDELIAALNANTEALKASGQTPTVVAEKVEPAKKVAKKKTAKKKEEKVVEAEVVEPEVAELPEEKAPNNEEVDITEAQLKELGMVLLKAKQMATYNEIVQSFGVKKVSELPLGEYDACYTKLREAVNAL